MPTCQSCNNHWSWKQTIKKMFTLDTGMNCPSCGNKQFLTSKSKKRSNVLIFLPPFIMLLAILFDIPAPVTLVLLAMAFFVATAIYPFLIKLTSVKEPSVW